VDVEVKHHLAAGAFVELLDGDAVGTERLHAGLGDLLRHHRDMAEHVRRHVEDIAGRGLGQNEGVARSPGHDVEEGERLVVLIDLVAGQLAAQDLGEDVVGVVGRHERSA
jgi:hypothetical protein